ncbi:MAG TPA: Crp/Fnr family transcriptional regulator [Candidatus Dormibacteraeota bacterium]|jgi:CRP-like cAMP-binding protein
MTIEGELQGLRIGEPALGDEVWAELLAGAGVRRVPPRRRVLAPTSPPSVAVVVHGLVRVFMWTARRTPVTIGYARHGRLVGPGALLSSGKIAAEAVVTSTVALVPADHLRDTLLRRPQAAWTLVEWAQRWYAAALTTAIEGMSAPLSIRVARHLLDMSMLTPGDETIAPVTHQHLADAVGTAREVVTRALGEFREHGLVITRRRHVVLRNPQGMARFAAGQDPLLRDPD